MILWFLFKQRSRVWSWFEHNFSILSDQQHFTFNPTMNVQSCWIKHYVQILIWPNAVKFIIFTFNMSYVLYWYADQRKTFCNWTLFIIHRNQYQSPIYIDTQIFIQKYQIVFERSNFPIGTRIDPIKKRLFSTWKKVYV